MYTSPRDNYAWQAKAGDQTVGSIVCKAERELEDDPYTGYIAMLAVDTAFRKHGIGKAQAFESRGSAGQMPLRKIRVRVLLVVAELMRPRMSLGAHLAVHPFAHPHRARDLSHHRVIAAGTSLALKAIEAMRDLGCEEVSMRAIAPPPPPDHGWWSS